MLITNSKKDKKKLENFFLVVLKAKYSDKMKLLNAPKALKKKII
jgi:hypothetical protein